MDRSAVISLISTQKTRNSKGVYETVETKKDIFCSVESVGQKEFFEGGANGFKPKLKFICFIYDYDDEQIVEYKGVRYDIYRTYIRKDDNIEIYVQKDLGVL